MMIADFRQANGFPQAYSGPAIGETGRELMTQYTFLNRNSTWDSVMPGRNGDILMVARLLQ